LEDLKNMHYLKLMGMKKTLDSDPVLQSNNTAAQVQANELLKTNSISHWTP